jgi:hypothetical protein
MEKDLLKNLIQIINPKEKPTADRVKMVHARLVDYTPDELIASAKELAKSEWHRDNGEMSIDNLIRPSKIGRWFAQSIAPEQKKVIF